MAKATQKGQDTIEIITSVQQLLRFDDGGPKHLLVQDNDIGGELLPILSKGLYTNPLDCVREYVQNGVDAGAKKIKIKVTGNSVIIDDDGSGMNMGELVEARKFGVSPKLTDEFAGFRGIGIYSGYDLSNRLIMKTKREGEANACVMQFDFANMKQQLGQAKKDLKTIPLNKLLTDNTTFGYEEWDDADDHFTVVQLEDISDVHIYKLSDRTELRKYILQNLPVDFDESFEYRDEIIKHLSLHVPNYKAVKIVLQSDDAPDELVAKPTIKNLRIPSFGYIKTATDKQNVAYFWACLNKERSRIDNEHNSGEAKPAKGRKAEDKNQANGSDNQKQPSIDLSEYQGFVYKAKGFTIGNRDKLIRYFTHGAGALYRWYTGEIYVLDKEVIPNAERDDFELSPAKTKLEAAVRDKLEELDNTAYKFREEGVADDKIDKNLKAFEDLESKRKSINNSDLLVKLADIIKEVKKHRPKASQEKKEAANTLLAKADKLQKQVRTQVDRASTSTQKGRSSQTTSTQDSSAGTSASNKNGEEQAAKSLIEVFNSFDWADSESYRRLIEIIDDILIGTLGQKSERYQLIVGQIEAQLNEEFTQ
jgi:molecular chaperone HtpG